MAAFSSRRKQEFMQRIDLCKKHVNEDGKLVLPRGNPETRALAGWLNRQLKRNDCPADEKELLDKLRQCRDSRSRHVHRLENWQFLYQQLVKYREEYHTFVISKKDKNHKHLYNWSFRQRRLAKINRLPPDRKEALEKIGFPFVSSHQSLNDAKRFTDSQKEKWDNMYQELVNYKNTVGHCRVKIDDKKHVRLAKWVHQQRVTFNSGNMDQKREERLNEIEFQWKLR